jgi:hypothetical protein
MTNEQRQTLETLALFAIQHVACGLVNQTYRRDENDSVAIYARCPACGAATRGMVPFSALTEQLRESLRS